MIEYFQLGANKTLSEIVFAGSHDAGIAAGGSNAKTQDMNLFLQAVSGVRFYDLRIAAFATGNMSYGAKQVELKAFHADGLLHKKKKVMGSMPGMVGSQRLTSSKLRKGGQVGTGLRKILGDARAFVEAYPTEFLLLKFDKCTNWGLIAQTCIDVLGAALYTGGGNLNLKTQQDLMGTVIVLFSESGKVAAGNAYLGGGIMGWRNLGHKEDEDSHSYYPNYDGLQYFGKGGTSVVSGAFRGYKGKTKMNLSKQKKYFKSGVQDGNPDVLGMMYWTSTGLLESIKKRNDHMWNGSNVTSLRRMWSNGLYDSIQSRVAHVDPTNHVSGATLKTFMPNIIMIDFADPTKCKTIYELNSVSSAALKSASINLDKEVDELYDHYADLQRNMRRQAHM
jgi:hypothetical protein